MLQELWTLEKQRADLASESERVKQDNEFMEGEINTLRATVTEQMQQVTSLKVRCRGNRDGCNVIMKPTFGFAQHTHMYTAP